MLGVQQLSHCILCTEAKATQSGADLKKALRHDIDDLARKAALQVRLSCPTVSPL